MDGLILWVGFVGAWLLFAGPIYQAALELQDQNIEFDKIRAAQNNIPKPPEISPWWWLLPPVKLLLEQRRSHKYRRHFYRALSVEDTKELINFMNKATAWFFVATGGLCIAIKETYELAEHNEWSRGAFWATLAAMLLLSIFNLIFRLYRSKKIIRAS